MRPVRVLPEADALALKNARQRGSLLDAEAVEREWSAILTLVRSRVLATPSRLARLSLEDQAALDLELRAALTELARDGAS
jgi:terminase small subunit / prophage DNA-packing protein